ncbi:hypothetical protein [Tengunoibacter tsumagoiensis]|uniref:Uncharacterized protein n=1 Tax=Tengunoibacter tsumagoiensis TaxID=2014871 RepID=A0A402A7S6_9CHLR|nr:hypothetical protein [Tengunoibacter tsumagoiensis]GCE15128.1 hypothetical protein KTT_49870 [Tengunoibacter tsumagoiensis]
MSQAIGRRSLFGNLAMPVLRWLLNLRLFSGLGILLGGVITLVGVSWDIQWHVFVGRDRTLTAPHIVMLSGIVIGGVLALMEVLIETNWVKRNSALKQYTTRFAGLFSSSIGSYIAGYGALASGLGFVLDTYWHALYGVDVAIWAPFHLMIFVGMSIMVLGSIYIIASVSRFTGRELDLRSAKIGHSGTVVAIAVFMGFVSILVPPAIDARGSLQIGGLLINFYPFLEALLVSFVFVATKGVLPSRLSATLVMLVYIGEAILFSLIVPPLTNWLLPIEGLHYRQGIGLFSAISIIAVNWPLTPIAIAPLVDACFVWARRLAWTERRRNLILGVISFIACIPVFVLPARDETEILAHAGIVGVTVSLLLGIVGIVIGIRLGHYTGEVMNQK